LTGELPFRGEVRMLLHQVASDEPPSPRRLNARVDRDIETICLKCLEKAPQRRYPSAQEMADDLQRFLDHEPIQARPVHQLERTWRWCRRNPVVAGLTSTVLLLALATAAVTSVAYVREARLAAENAQLARDEKSSRERAELTANEKTKLAAENAGLAAT